MVSSARWREPVAWLVGWLAVVGLAAWVIRPFRAGPAAFDAAASVLYFERISSGRTLEALVNTTPKPLLTLVYGVLHGVTDDWRAVSWAAIAVLGLAVVLGSALAARSGGRVGAAFVFVALALAGALTVETTWAYGLPWAAAGWFVAGLALTARPPRYGLAGLALLLAALVRVETLVLLAVITVILVWRWLATRTSGAARPDPMTWLLLLGWLAVPIMALHDALLTGDPLYWTTVASRYAAEVTVRSPASVLGLIGDLLIALAPFVLLGLAGAVVLWRGRRWVELTGLGVASVGIAAVVMLVAVRGLSVIPHYLDPIGLAAMVAAGVGFAAISLPLIGRADPRSASATAAAVAGIVAAGLVASHSAFSEEVQAAVSDQRILALHSDTVAPVVADGAAKTEGRVIVPASLLARLAVDTGLPLTRLYSLQPGVAFGGSPTVGDIVYHDRLADAGIPEADLGELEVTRPTLVDDALAVPLLSDPIAGVWVVRLDPTPTVIVTSSGRPDDMRG